MSKIAIVARHQFLKEVRKRSFLLVLFALPLFLLFSVGLGIVIERLEAPQALPLGYVDLAGVLTTEPVVPGGVVRFDSAESARQALDSGTVGAYYVISADYPTTRRVDLVYVTPPDSATARAFADSVRRSLLGDIAPPVLNRIAAGATVTVRDSVTGRLFPATGPAAGSILPLIAAVIFVFLIITTAGYLTSVLVEEKENRTIEIVITSLTPGQLMAGKIAGAVGIALLQLITWLACLALAVWVGRNVLDLAWLQTLTAVPWRDVAAVAVVALPTYLLIAATMTIIGSLLSEGQEAQQAGMLFFIPLFLPIYLIVPVFENPHGPLAQLITLLPVTSVMALGLRSLITLVPLWQIAASFAVSAVAALALVWLAGRAVRVNMLRYGQALSWRRLVAPRAR